MDILLSFHKLENESKRANIKDTIYKYSNVYKYDNQIIEILSNKEISKIEVESLGKIYISKDKEKILKKGYIDLIVDRYIILNQ